MTSGRFLLAITFAVPFVAASCTVTYTDPPDAAAYVEPPPPPDQEFYELNAHGEWLDVYPHGLIWRPYVTATWRPYIYGHWVWSDWGWTWVSYEPFGWAVYHYGFWTYDPVWGWIWIPGMEWEPVRVQWVAYGDYVCWAPAPPPGYVLPDPWLTRSADLWVVVHARHFTHYDLHRFRVKPSSYKDHYPRGDTIMRRPPRMNDIERHTRKTVPHVHLKTKAHESGGRTYKVVQLPEHEQKIVRKYGPHVKKRAADPEWEGRVSKEKQSKSKETPQKDDKSKGKTRSKTKSKSKNKGSG
jgi:hypothetical protein